MKVMIEGQVLAVYKNTNYKNKETGEVSEGKYKMEFVIENELANGSIRHDMQDITIPDSRVKEFEAQIGKKIQIKCNVISKAQISFYVK